MTRIAHAVRSENGNKFGKAGDQDGREVRLDDWYDSGWQNVFRPKDDELSFWLGEYAVELANNQHVGYSQACSSDPNSEYYGKKSDWRTSLYTELKKVDFEPEALKVDVNCDCSSFVAACLNAMGINVPYDMSTSSEVDAIMKTGKFDRFTTKEFLTSGSKLRAGDILHKVGHTAIVYKGDADNEKTMTMPKTDMALQGEMSVSTFSKWLEGFLLEEGISSAQALKASQDFKASIKRDFSVKADNSNIFNVQLPFLVKVVSVKTPVYTRPDGKKVTLTVNPNEVYTIVEINDHYGHLKSGAGWLDLNTVKILYHVSN